MRLTNVQSEMYSSEVEQRLLNMIANELKHTPPEPVSLYAEYNVK